PYHPHPRRRMRSSRGSPRRLRSESSSSDPSSGCRFTIGQDGTAHTGCQTAARRSSPCQCRALVSVLLRIYARLRAGPPLWRNGSRLRNLLRTLTCGFIERKSKECALSGWLCCFLPCSVLAATRSAHGTHRRRRG